MGLFVKQKHFKRGTAIIIEIEFKFLIPHRGFLQAYRLGLRSLQQNYQNM